MERVETDKQIFLLGETGSFNHLISYPNHNNIRKYDQKLKHPSFYLSWAVQIIFIQSLNHHSCAPRASSV